MDDGKKHFRFLKKGRWYCPRCGHEMIWNTQEMFDENDELPDEDNYIITIYSCPYCGLELQIHDKPVESEREGYPYWNENQEK